MAVNPDSNGPSGSSPYARQLSQAIFQTRANVGSLWTFLVLVHLVELTFLSVVLVKIW